MFPKRSMNNIHTNKMVLLWKVCEWWPVTSDSVHWLQICLRKIEKGNTLKHLICYVTSLFWLLCNKGTRVCFFWIPSHCGIDGNERLDHLTKVTLDHKVNPLTSVHYADLKPLVKPYIQIQQLVDIKCNFELEIVPIMGLYNRIYYFVYGSQVAVRDPYMCRTNSSQSNWLQKSCGEDFHHNCAWLVETRKNGILIIRIPTSFNCINFSWKESHNVYGM